MRQAGEVTIAAPREAVWRALNDPEMLKAAIEGCEALERTREGTFEGRVRARIGPVSAVFSGKVEIVDPDPPNAYRLKGQGQGAAGFARGEARVTLEEAGPDTLLKYEAEGQVGGRLAQVGQRLIDAAARQMAGDFFTRLGAELAPADVPLTPQPRKPNLAWPLIGAIAALAIAALAFALAR